MSKNLEKKLLAEAFDSLVNDNDIAKATRLMKRHLDLVAQSQYQLLESEDEDFEVTDMGDDFNNEVAAEAGSDDEERFEQVQIAIDELEDKFPAEMTEEVESKFDELRNIVDELKLADEGDEVSAEDANVIIEDLKADFEMAGEISDEVNDLFDEISSGIQGGDVEDVEEIDVEDDDSEFDVDVEDEEIEECNTGKKLEESDDTDVDLAMEDEEVDGEDIEADTDEDVDADFEDDMSDESDDDELVYDIKSDAEELLAKIEELEARDGGEEVKESFEKIADPRKKSSSESEGVEKKRTMNFGKLSGMTLKKGSDLMNGKVSKGTEPCKSTKTQPIAKEQNAKNWKKTEKPANKPASSKSMLG
jgi:hypothetical protein